MPADETSALLARRSAVVSTAAIGASRLGGWILGRMTFEVSLP
ncbi:MAG TPA: hypothetical protein VNN25_26405 [Thermoanaerobaculia bacterium]|nr:hypothetical protein [Thermoanaerobaculia bacterium]